MRFRPEHVNREREKLDKSPITEQQLMDIYRKYMHEHRDIVRHEDAVSQVAIGLP